MIYEYPWIFASFVPRPSFEDVWFIQVLVCYFRSITDCRSEVYTWDSIQLICVTEPSSCRYIYANQVLLLQDFFLFEYATLKSEKRWIEIISFKSCFNQILSFFIYTYIIISSYWDSNHDTGPKWFICVKT